MELERAPFDLRRASSRWSTSSVRWRAKKGLEFAYGIEPSTPETAVGRRQPPAPDPAEPAEQRGEVHGGGRDRRRRRDEPFGSRRRDRVPPHRSRHRDRHPAGARRPAVPVVQPGRRDDEPTVRRHRARARDQPAARRADGRHDVGRERRGARRGQHVPRDDRVRRDGHDADRPSPRRIVRRPARAGRRRQRDEPAVVGGAARRLGHAEHARHGRRRRAGRARRRTVRRRDPRHADARHGRARPRRQDPSSSVRPCRSCSRRR